MGAQGSERLDPALAGRPGVDDGQPTADLAGVEARDGLVERCAPLCDQPALTDPVFDAARERGEPRTDRTGRTAGRGLDELLLRPQDVGDEVTPRLRNGVGVG